MLTYLMMIRNVESFVMLSPLWLRLTAFYLKTWTRRWTVEVTPTATPCT